MLYFFMKIKRRACSSSLMQIKVLTIGYSRYYSVEYTDHNSTDIQKYELSDKRGVRNRLSQSKPSTNKYKASRRLEKAATPT